jgi:hypothetical protein
MTGKPITMVKDQYGDRLMAIPGVVGVGVGECGGQPCIKVFVARLADLTARVPTQLDGYPVAIEETGDFHARGIG